MVILQSIYTETVPSKDPWNCPIFFCSSVMKVLNYSEGTTEIRFSQEQLCKTELLEMSLY